MNEQTFWSTLPLRQQLKANRWTEMTYSKPWDQFHLEDLHTCETPSLMSGHAGVKGHEWVDLLVDTVTETTADSKLMDWTDIFKALTDRVHLEDLHSRETHSLPGMQEVWIKIDIASTYKRWLLKQHRTGTISHKILMNLLLRIRMPMDLSTNDDSLLTTHYIQLF